MAIPRNLETIVENYRSQLSRRWFENPEVKQAKEQLLDLLLHFDESINAPTQIEQIQIKLKLIEQIQFGHATAKDISERLSRWQPGSSEPLLFRRSSSFVKTLIDGFLKLIGAQPNTHFDDVLKITQEALNEQLQAEVHRQQQPLVHTPSQIANLAAISTETLADKPRKDKPDQAIRDFMRSTQIAGESIQVVEDENGEAESEEQYKAKIRAKITALTGEQAEAGENGEPTFKSGYAHEIYHIAAQGLVGCFQEAMMDAISVFQDHSYLPSQFSDLVMNWAMDEKGLYFDFGVNPSAFCTTEMPPKFYVADQEHPGKLKELNDLEMTEQKDNLLPVIEIKGRIRYHRDENGQVRPQAESFIITNHFPGTLTYSKTACQRIEKNAPHHAPQEGGPPWTHEAGAHPLADLPSPGSEEDSEEEPPERHP